jgi:hypothetical protein
MKLNMKECFRQSGGLVVADLKRCLEGLSEETKIIRPGERGERIT